MEVFRAVKHLQIHFTLKGILCLFSKKRPNVERERGQNSYAAKFAVRKGIGPISSFQQSLQRDSNEKQTTSKDYFVQSSQDLSPYQAQNSDFEPNLIGGSPRSLINGRLLFQGFYNY